MMNYPKSWQFPIALLAIATVLGGVTLAEVLRLSIIHVRASDISDSAKVQFALRRQVFQISSRQYKVGDTVASDSTNRRSIRQSWQERYGEEEGSLPQGG
jgi:hypothetical protein